MHISNIDHIVLTTKDIRQCLSFYGELLGMEVLRENGRYALRFGDAKINIHRFSGEFQPAAERPSAGSLDFCLITEDPIEAVYQELKNKKAPFVTDIVERKGALRPMRSFYLRDPDGNLVEIAGYTEKKEYNGND